MPLQQLPENASAEDIAIRLADMVRAIPDGHEFVVSRLQSLIIPNAPNPRATAELQLKETLEAADGKRQISIFLRRFLKQPRLQGVLAETFPVFEAALQAQEQQEDAQRRASNAKAVEQVTNVIPRDITDAPPAASFKPRVPRSF